MLSNSLKQIRMQKFMMSRVEFARHIGVGEPQYSRYERRAAQPSLEVAIKISNSLGVTVNDIWQIDKSTSDEQ